MNKMRLNVRWGWMFETHRRICVVSLSKTLYPLLGTATQEDRKSSLHDWIIVDWDIKQQHKQIFTNNLDPDQAQHNVGLIWIQPVWQSNKISQRIYLEF